MKRQRLYAVDMTAYPPESIEWKPENDCEEWEFGSYEIAAEEDRDGVTWIGFYKGFTPQGWEEYAVEQWPNYEEVIDGVVHYVKPFFWPSTDKVFRSRSAAQARVDLINRWGGNAVLVECTPEWLPVTEANRRRKVQAMQARIAAAQARLDALNAEYFALENEVTG